MYKKTVITSWTTALCLCLITVITASVEHHLNYQVAVSVFSYIGVYAIALYLSKSNSTEKIVLTLVNILGTAMLIALMYSAVTKYHGIVMVGLLLISLVGAVTGLMAIWFNNKFEKVDSEKH